VNTNNDESKKVSFTGKIRASFSGRKFRSGAYATIISAAVIAVVLVANLLISKMNITFDLSLNNAYTLTEETKELVRGLKDDVTIYYMVQQGNEVNEFEKIAKQYEKYSNKISLVNKDPILYPQFASQFVDDEIAENSFIVVNSSNNRAKYIDGNDMVIQELNYQTYQYDTTGTDAEGKLTSAILYVTTQDLPVMYVVQGHGETPASQSFNDSVAKMNIDVQSLETLTQSSVPEDCDILYINSPQKDFTEEETTMLKDYLTAGGKAIITVNYKSAALSNFASILDYYGIKMVNGEVVESNQSMYYPGQPKIAVPTLENHDITSKATSGNIPIIMPFPIGLTIADNIRSSLTVEPLLLTSTSAFSKQDVNSTSFTKESGDIAGPFNLGIVATDTFNDVTSSIAVFSTEFTFSDDTADYGNGKLLTGTVGFLSDNTDILSIPAKSYGASFVYPSQLQAFSWAGMVCVAIPVVIFLIGAVICLRRRKK
jgi:ABC-2 type transport system permease protein